MIDSSLGQASRIAGIKSSRAPCSCSRTSFLLAFAGRNDAYGGAAHRVDQDENPSFYSADKPVAILAVIPPAVPSFDPDRIEERSDGIREIEAASSGAV